MGFEILVQLNASGLTGNKKKKKLQEASRFVSSLIESGKLLEAEFFLGKFIAIKPDDKSFHVLGYKLAIRKIDINAVAYFNDKVISLKVDKLEVLLLQLDYFYVVNNFESFRQVLKEIFSIGRISVDILSDIIQLIITDNDYGSHVILIDYIKTKRLVVNKGLEVHLKKVMITKLVNVIAEGKYE